MKEANEFSSLSSRCLERAEAMSDNGICWADEADVNDLLSGLKADGSNLEEVAWSIAEVANWFN
jgi:hypothetical protein